MSPLIPFPVQDVTPRRRVVAVVLDLGTPDGVRRFTDRQPYMQTADLAAALAAIDAYPYPRALPGATHALADDLRAMVARRKD